MRITGIDHVQVSVPVGSEDAVRDFYCGLLGLTEVPKPEVLRARGGLWLVVGDRSLHFGAETVPDRSASKRHVAFEVADLAEARRALESAGMSVEDGVAIPGCTRFECRDPFGNRIEFVQRSATPG